MNDAPSVNPLISIIIPVHNGERFLELVIRTVIESPIEKEIVIVNDGSTDGSAAILEHLQEELPLTVLTHPRCLGNGRAIRAGLAVCRGSIVLFQHADLEYDPEDYPAWLEPLMSGRATVVYGSRFLEPRRTRDVWHRLGNWMVTLFVNVLFRTSLTDVETGYKALRRDVVDELPLRSTGVEVEVELTCRLLQTAQRIVEVPVTYYGRADAQSKKIAWKDGARALWTILCCRLSAVAMPYRAASPSSEPIRTTPALAQKSMFDTATEPLNAAG